MNQKLLNEIVNKIKHYKSIKRAYVFGSRSRGDHHDRSDIDLAIDAPDISDQDYTELYLYFQEDCPTLLEVDLLNVSRVGNPVLIDNIIREGVVIYERNQSDTESY